LKAISDGIKFYIPSPQMDPDDFESTRLKDGNLVDEAEKTEL
jgi:hypothetical protein